MTHTPAELDHLVTTAEQHRGTPEGDALADAARALRAAVRNARGPVLAITAAPGIPLDDLVGAFGERHSDVAVTVTRSHAAARAVRTGAADLAVVRMPAHLHGLGVQPLGAEEHVVALWRGDALAARSAVSLEELAHHHLLQNPDTVPEWRERAHELRGLTVGTRESLVFGVLSTLDQQLEQVALGNGVVIIPRSVAAEAAEAGGGDGGGGRADVAFVAVEGLEQRRLALAWNASSPWDEVLAFAAVAAGLR